MSLWLNTSDLNKIHTYIQLWLLGLSLFGSFIKLEFSYWWHPYGSVYMHKPVVDGQLWLYAARCHWLSLPEVARLALTLVYEVGTSTPQFRQNTAVFLLHHFEECVCNDAERFCTWWRPSWPECCTVAIYCGMYIHEMLDITTDI